MPVRCTPRSCALMLMNLSRLVSSLVCTLVVLLGTAELTAQQNSDVVDITFSGFGNPQRPFPGFVGAFQLGPVSIQGSVSINRRTGAVVRGGEISHSDDLKDPRFPNHRTMWRVVRAAGFSTAAGVSSVRLGVQVTSSNFPQICPVGTFGIIDLVDDERRMPNNQTGDAIRTETPNPQALNSLGTPACGTHTHGMNNFDVSWTDPKFGGPGGGMWANVQMNVPRRSGRPDVIKQCEGQVCGTWTRVSDTEYDAAWSNGARAKLRFEYAGNRVKIYRTDTAQQGFTAVYTATISGSRFTNGKVIWSFRGQDTPGTWTGSWEN